ncbi:MAG TPA: adenine phosphoribosyltransferase [Haploplasma sp.]|nr:adenine phosphoribosyltransferase [Haploplasma sp.]
MNLKDYIASIEDFPKKGITFRDITPLMANGEAFRYANNKIAKFAREVGANLVVGPEARGFIFGCPVAYDLNIGFVPVRKPGKLPREIVSVKYELEYGHNELSIHDGDIKPGSKVLIVDDLLATGGTIKATIDLVESQGAVVVGVAFLIELEDLKGIELLKDYKVISLMKY